MGAKNILDVFAAVGQRQSGRDRAERGEPDHIKRSGLAWVCRLMGACQVMNHVTVPLPAPELELQHTHPASGTLPSPAQ